MTKQDTGGSGLAAGEREQLVYQIETRMAAHKDAAANAVRDAEQTLTDVREALARAQDEADRARYVSDRLPFMRQSVAEEIETLERVSNEKRVRASYRFLIDRAIELAAAEVRGFHDAQDDERREREEGVEALIAAEQRAVRALEQAQAMQQRVADAEDSARRGLGIMVEKLSAPS